MNAETVTNALFRYFNAYRGYKYQLCNAYVFNWESDFFCLAQSGYSYEIEVKVSKGDFWADFNKEKKHNILQRSLPNPLTAIPTFKHPGIPDSQQKRWEEGHKSSHLIRSRIKWKETGLVSPNKFLYACPTGLITKQECPEYAGLVYVDADQRRKPEIIVRAPSLHTHKSDYTKILLKKYYWAYLNSLGNTKAGKNFEFPDESRKRMVRTK